MATWFFELRYKTHIHLPVALRTFRRQSNVYRWALSMVRDVLSARLELIKSE